MTLQKVKGTYTLPHVIKADWTAYLIFSIFFGPIVILGIFATLKNSSAWPVSFVALIFLVAFLAWINSFKIILSDDKIIYKTLFSKNKEAIFSKINNMEINIGLKHKANAKSAFYQLDIYERGSIELLSINMKPFSKRDLAIIVDTIAIKAPSAKMDELTYQLKEGDFKLIVSEGIRKSWQVLLIIAVMSLSIAIFHALVANG